MLRTKVPFTLEISQKVYSPIAFQCGIGINRASPQRLSCTPVFRVVRFVDAPIRRTFFSRPSVQPTMSNAMDIYQQIFDIDISKGSGIPAVLPGEPVDESIGYVVVNESFDVSRPSQVIQKVVIPESKRKSYQLAARLFDNYDLLSSIPDVITASEQQEVDDLLAYVVDTAPMQLARDYIVSRTRRPISDSAWYALVKEAWFRPFAIGSSPTRSGFEHVFVGEWKDSNNSVGGLHFWYFFNEIMEDISYNGAVYDISDSNSGLTVPELATMTFTWTIGGQTLYKRIGGFFIGPSVEGLMAMGMVRFSSEAAAPNPTYIEGMEIDLKMYKSPDGRSVNTFYPVLKRVVIGQQTPTPTDPTGPAPIPEETTGPGPFLGPNENGAAENKGVRIITAKANPDGHDEGREMITLINMFGDGVIDLRGWKVQGPNKSTLTFGEVFLERGEARTFVVPARGSLQLSNKGGTITLMRPDGSTEQTVKYDNDVARIQGGVLVWNGLDNLVLIKS